MEASRRTELTLVNHKHSKAYAASLIPQGAGWVVEFSYGAIGAPQRPGTKTPVPVPYATALKIYEKLIAEKAGKPCECCGTAYTSSEALPTPCSAPAPGAEGSKATRQTASKQVEHSPFAPELLSPVDVEGSGRIIRSGQYGCMKKYDGHRWALSQRSGELVAFNRLGKQVQVPASIREALTVQHDIMVDGEFVNGQFIAFDLLEIEGSDIRNLQFGERHSMLAEVLAGTKIAVAPLATGQDAIMALIEFEHEHRGEGVVFKHLKRGYMPGRQGTNLKLKFWVSGTFRVAKKQKSSTNHSFGVEAFNGGAWTYCGSVTCKGPLPEIGTYREVKYLYVGAGGHLYQPEDWGAREDVQAHDCLHRELKHKQDRERAL